MRWWRQQRPRLAETRGRGREIDEAALREVIEVYGVGEFDELFSVGWTSLDSFIATAKDYVVPEERAEFEAVLRKKVSRS